MIKAPLAHHEVAGGAREAASRLRPSVPVAARQHGREDCGASAALAAARSRLDTAERAAAPHAAAAAEAKLHRALKTTAGAYTKLLSATPIPELFGVNDGKTVSTHVEAAFNAHIHLHFTHEKENGSIP